MISVNTTPESPLRDCQACRCTAYVIVGLKTWIDSVPRLAARCPIFFNVFSSSSQFLRARLGKDFLFLRRFCEKSARSMLCLLCERYNPDAGGGVAILRTLDPAFQASVDEAVDGVADGSRRSMPLWAVSDLPAKGPFVQRPRGSGNRCRRFPSHASPA